jgi:hypothetical protein
MHPYKFSTSDYNSSDGMLTTVWGPLVWHFLHIISFNYPVEPTQTDINHYYNFLLSLGHVLPCFYCRQNYPENFEKSGGHDIRNYLSRARFSKLIYRLHNNVNLATGKSVTIDYDSARDRYEVFRARCLSGVPNTPRYPTASRAKEPGCTTPIYGQKSKTVVMIVPQAKRVDTYIVDPKCKLFQP